MAGGSLCREPRSAREDDRARQAARLELAIGAVADDGVVCGERPAHLLTLGLRVRLDDNLGED